MRRAARSAIGLRLAVLLSALASCAGMQKALDAGGEHATEAGGAAVFGWAAWMIHPVGAIGALLAGVGGWLGGLFFHSVRPAAAAPGSSGGFPYGVLLLGVVAALIVRAWAHYPNMVRKAWLLFKATARGLLGGLEKRLPELPPDAKEIK